MWCSDFWHSLSCTQLSKKWFDGWNSIKFQFFFSKDEVWKYFQNFNFDPHIFFCFKCFQPLESLNSFLSLIDLTKSFSLYLLIQPHVSSRVTKYSCFLWPSNPFFPNIHLPFWPHFQLQPQFSMNHFPTLISKAKIPNHPRKKKSEICEFSVATASL